MGSPILQYAEAGMFDPSYKRSEADLSREMDLSSLRKDYSAASLSKEELLPDPLHQFQKWLQEAISSGEPEPNAMTLATASREGKPSLRTLLLKEADRRGLVFFTNYNSRKGREIASNPFGGLLFFWKQPARQVCTEGRIEKLSREESDLYFAKRPRASQLGARISEQDEPLSSRQELERRYVEEEARWEGREIERPQDWGGYRLLPSRYEFWQGRERRLHDRFVYYLEGPTWLIQRLSP